MVCNRLWRCWPALALVGVLALAVSTWRPIPRAAQASDQLSSDSPVDAPEPIPPEIVGDLLQLRQSPKFGLFQNPGAFEPVATDAPQLAPAGSDDKLGDRELFSSELERLSRLPHPADNPPETVFVAQPAACDQSQESRRALSPDTIQVLRAAAFELEKVAHHLECREQCQRADQLRQLAQQMREDARQSSPGLPHHD